MIVNQDIETKVMDEENMVTPLKEDIFVEATLIMVGTKIIWKFQWTTIIKLYTHKVRQF